VSCVCRRWGYAWIDRPCPPPSLAVVLSAWEPSITSSKLPANSPRPTSSASHGNGLEALDLEQDTRCTSDSVPLLVAGQTPTTPVE
jgi:hypothetical protein